MEAGSGTGFLMLEVVVAVDMVAAGGEGDDVELRKAGRCGPIDRFIGGSCPMARLDDGGPIERAVGGTCPRGVGAEDVGTMGNVWAWDAKELLRRIGEDAADPLNRDGGEGFGPLSMAGGDTAEPRTEPGDGPDGGL